MVLSAFKLPVSDCPKCGAPGRFVGIERDDLDKKTSIFTFECDACGSYDVRKMNRDANGGRLHRNGASQRPRHVPR